MYTIPVLAVHQRANVALTGARLHRIVVALLNRLVHYMYRPHANSSADADYASARWHAVLGIALNILRRQRRELLPYAEVASHFLIRGQHDLGLQTVPLAKIVGSQGRYADFDRHFLPRSTHTAERWKSVSRAHHRNVELPPVELYKLGGIYFVADGNHRISVARYAGQIDITARVTEISIDVPLTPDLELSDLVLKEEQGDFFEWTNLAQLRPGCAIEVTELGGYLELIRHINWQRSCLAVQRDTEVTAQEAVLDWYDTVYLPLVETIRAGALLRSFSDRTETDLYIWVMEHGQELLEQKATRRAGWRLSTSREWLAALRRRMGRTRGSSGSPGKST